jgi:KUP system potassium uptake protein
MRACVNHLHALPEHAIILSIENLPTPRIRPADRLEIDDLLYRDDGITLVRAKQGYAEHYDVPALVAQIANSGVESPPDMRDISFYLSRIELRPVDRPGMRRWRKHLYAATALLTAEQADYFRLPRGRTITLGSEIEF